MGVGEDRLSVLPDGVLLHILSFLPTADAVGTSILSKRWVWLWTFLPNLSFSYAPINPFNQPNRDFEQARRFMNYLDRVLLHHQWSNISKFELTCDDSCDEFRVNSWISAVGRHELEELYLHIYLEGPYVVPQSIFTCESLTKMTLYKSGILLQPTSFSLPNLKKLYLSCVSFTDEYLTQKLFSSLPVLEDLTLNSCKWVNHKILLISIPSLKCFNLSGGFGEDSDLCDCAIKICAPNLETFICSTRKLLKDFILCDLSSLVYAEYYTEEYIPLLTEEERCNSACNLLNGLFNVKVLKIPADVVKVLPNEDMGAHLPMFHNVTEFTVSRFCSSFDVLCLLQLMPNLESLVFDQTYADSEDELILDTVPLCLLSSLKKVQVEEYEGHMGESYIIEFLLKNALVLERMAITYGIMMTEDSSEIKEDRIRFSMLPKGSISCVLEFFDYPGSREECEDSETDNFEEPADPPANPPAEEPHADLPADPPADM